jgi:hypothetical protein
VRCHKISLFAFLKGEKIKENLKTGDFRKLLLRNWLPQRNPLGVNPQIAKGKSS